MPMLSFYGASDDLLEIGINGTVVDEISCYDAPIEVEACDHTGAKVCVVYEHAKHGWQALVRLDYHHEDGEPMLPVAISLASSGYSPKVEIELSEDGVATFSKRVNAVQTKVVGIFEQGKFALAEGE